MMSTLPPELPNADSTRHPEAGRLQVYSGNLQVSTTDIESSANRLIAMVKEKNGYLQSRTDALVVCRVPRGELVRHGLDVARVVQRGKLFAGGCAQVPQL